MARKNLGAFPGIYPMPVLMVATYNREDEQDRINVMTAAW